MQDFSAQLVAAFERSLDRGKVPPNLRQEYHKWLRFYLMFCQKYAYSPALPTSLGPFLTRLAAKHQPIDQRHLAAAAIKLFIRHTCQDKPDTPETGAAETSLNRTGHPIRPFARTCWHTSFRHTQRHPRSAPARKGRRRDEGRS